MNIYLDIDGVLLTKSLTPANYVRDFLEWALKNHDAYWLTTRCKGDAHATFLSIARHFEPEVHPFLQKIKPTNWETLKTEGIDMNSDFLWFDDYVMQAELQVLSQAKKTQSLIMIDLQKEPDSLKRCLELDRIVG